MGDPQGFSGRQEHLRSQGGVRTGDSGEPGSKRSLNCCFEHEQGQGRGVHAFIRDVYLQEQKITNVEFTDRGTIDMSGLQGRRLGARFVDSGIISTFDVTLIPDPPGRVWVFSARPDATSTPQERDEIYPRILHSVRRVGRSTVP
jgi:hypothetical protein